MRLELTSLGPVMWCIGSPQDLKIHLTTIAPGPIEVDFDSLTMKEQLRVLKALQKGHLSSDQPFESLVKTYQEAQAAELRTQITTQEEEKKPTLWEAEAQRNKEIMERCEYLVKQPVRSVKAALKEEKDLKFLKSFLAMEQKNKDRKVLIRFTKEQIQKEESKIADSLSRSLQEEPLPIKTSAAESKMLANVIESEERSITFSEEQLQALENLGGE